MAFFCASVILDSGIPLAILEKKCVSGIGKKSPALQRMLCSKVVPDLGRPARKHGFVYIAAQNGISVELQHIFR
jgi:hypothetical protein